MLAIPLNSFDAINAKTSKLFGKAPYVLLISPDGSTEVLQNKFKSGKELATELVRLGVKTLITNHLGQKAFEILSSHGVNILHSGESISVAESLEAYKAGTLRAFDASMVQQPKHRNEGEYGHGKHGEDECCGHEHDGGHSHKHGEKCCKKEDGEKGERRGRCCHRG